MKLKNMLDAGKNSYNENCYKVRTNILSRMNKSFIIINKTKQYKTCQLPRQ